VYIDEIDKIRKNLGAANDLGAASFAEIGGRTSVNFQIESTCQPTVTYDSHTWGSTRTGTNEIAP
jgi:hypothetical protein